MLPTVMTDLLADLDHNIKGLVRSIPRADLRNEGILAGDAIFYMVAASFISGQYSGMTKIVPVDGPGGPTVATTQGPPGLWSLTSVQDAWSQWRNTDGPHRPGAYDTQADQLAAISPQLPIAVWRSLGAACASLL